MKINTILKTWSLVVVVGTLQGCELFEIFSECSTFTLGGTGQTPEHCDKAKMMEIAQNQKNYDEYVLKLPQPLPCVKEQKLKVDPKFPRYIPMRILQRSIMKTIEIQSFGWDCIGITTLL